MVKEGEVVGSCRAVGQNTGVLGGGEERQWRGEEAWGGQGDIDLLLEGDLTLPFVVQEGSNCDWL